MNQSRMGNGEDSAVDGKENPRKSGKATKKGETHKHFYLSILIYDTGTHTDMEKLFTAIENNDMKTIKSLLPKIDVNVLTETNLYGSKFSWAPLHAAAYFGQSDVVEQLIAHGADIELSDKWYHSVRYKEFSSFPRVGGADRGHGTLLETTRMGSIWWQL